MKSNEIFTILINKYFHKTDIENMKELELLDELRILWGVMANKVTVVSINNKEYQLSMSFIELSRGLGAYFFSKKKKYVRTEFFIHSRDCTLTYDEDDEIKACVDFLIESCNVVAIYYVEFPPFLPRFGFAPYVWINFKTTECLYFARRIRKGKIASVINSISLEQYDTYVEKIQNILNKPVRKSNARKKKKTAKK